MIFFITIAFAGLLVSCSASLPPQELVNKRQAYYPASTGQTAQLVPPELHKAQTALGAAEKSFKEAPDSYGTRDLAYIAYGKSQKAEALAVITAENNATAKAKKDYKGTQAEIKKKTNAQLTAAQKTQGDAEKDAAEAQAKLAKLATVKKEAHGLVIILSGSFLFASNKSTLSSAAQDRLNKVADALLVTKERKLTVEGYTDSRGSLYYNVILSQKRAEVVRSYLISRGYSGDLIQIEGIGEENPVANNNTAEGRANNRRVEIVVDF